MVDGQSFDPLAGRIARPLEDFDMNGIVQSGAESWVALSRKCAICGSVEKRMVFQQRFALPSANYVHAGYDVVICKACDFAYADNLPDQSFFDTYYTNTGGKGAGEAYGNRHANSVGNIVRFARQTDRILDIGCGSGEILAMLAARGYRDLLGLEPGEEYCEATRRRGIEVVRGTLSDDIEVGQFDFAILSHVLEHVQDVRRTVSRLQELLRPGGGLYVEVPDADGFNMLNNPSVRLEWDFAKDLFAQFCPEHVNFFTTKSLGNLMRRTGFAEVFLESQVSVLGVVASVWTPAALTPDAAIDGQLRQYVTESEAILDKIRPAIAAAANRADGILVWGAGLHTQRLLANTQLGKAKILAFVDSNPAYRGMNLLGHPIVGPQDVPGFPPVPILISSRRLQDDIEQTIVALGLGNERLLLYPRGR